MNEIRRGRERIHGAHKDDPQYREWLKLYISGDKVGPFEPWMVEWLEECAFEDREAYGETGDQQRWGRIAAALSSLWMEGDDA